MRGGGVVATHLDHRIAMSFLVMGLAAAKPMRSTTPRDRDQLPCLPPGDERLGATFEVPIAETRRP